MKVPSTKLVLFCNGYLVTIKYEHIQFNEYYYNLLVASTTILMDFGSSSL